MSAKKRKPGEQTEKEKRGLPGPVSRIDETYYLAHFRAGKIVQGTLTNEDHDRDRIIIGFNEKGDRIDKETFFYSGHSMKHVYDDFGRMIESYNYESNVLKSKTFNEYSDDGLTGKMTHYDHNGEKISEDLIQYNERGDMTFHQTIHREEQYNQSSWIFYDDNEKWNEQKRVRPDGTITFWQTYKKDEHGSITETNTLNPDGSIKETKYNEWIYDKDGQCIGSNGRIWQKDKVYDSVEFEHDKHGNWITKVDFQNKVPVYMGVRKISYFGEQPKDNEETENHETVKSINYSMEMENNNKCPGDEKSEPTGQEKKIKYTKEETALMSWVAGASSHDNFSALRYYVILNNDLPSSTSYDGEDIEAIALKNVLCAEMKAEVVHSYYQITGEAGKKRLVRYTLSFPDNGYLLQATQIQEMKADEYTENSTVSFHGDENFPDSVFISSFILLHPSEASGEGDDDFEYSLQSWMDMCLLEKKPDKPEIYMVEVRRDGNFQLQSHAVYDDFEIKNLDINYGYGFEKFHNEMMQRFQDETKGLILFYGEPGTGKTYYIRHLLRKMTANNKKVIYIPPNMVDYLVQPAFLTFLSNEISTHSHSGFSCILLIEDAEPLLAMRNPDVRVPGISNLLNMTDGLLNDMLKLQIICTFNVKVKELDKALLRPGRLVARKEFKAMTVLDANRLGQQLGINYHFTKAATLAEVYAMVKNRNTLVHSMSEKDGEE